MDFGSQQLTLDQGPINPFHLLVSQTGSRAIDVSFQHLKLDPEQSISTLKPLSLNQHEWVRDHFQKQNSQCYLLPLDPN